ncbi:MAG: 3-ketoacyl-ACP reductase [Ruminococcaceae bacterium]|nr:3-ketoacyl-ACP reductase [Oscillospiraceae bacterium]
MKNVMITGCASGIGLATAKKFIDEGYTVCGMSRRKMDSKEIIDNERFHYFSGDISSSDDRKGFLEYSLKTMGNIDILINVAGVAPKERNDLLNMTEESYDYVMDINTKGTLFMTQIVANEMIKNEPVDGIRGYILNTSSISAYTSSVNRGEYCISKAGVSMITTLFADRLAEYGIMVNETRPGVIKTDMTSTVEDKYTKLIEDGIFPIKRWGYDEDLAETAFTLCTGRLPYMTGQVINVDGGFHIRRL